MKKYLMNLVSDWVTAYEPEFKYLDKFIRSYVQHITLSKILTVSLLFFILSVGTLFGMMFLFVIATIILRSFFLVVLLFLLALLLFIGYLSLKFAQISIKEEEKRGKKQ